jgi:poly-gamma-glutamate capsule biosynthesis protein CapA/YwtB (metallophosphatase superfamily)
MSRGPRSRLYHHEGALDHLWHLGGPLEAARNPLELKHVLAAFAGAEAEDRSVVLNEHHATTYRHILAAERTFEYPDHL